MNSREPGSWPRRHHRRHGRPWHHHPHKRGLWQVMARLRFQVFVGLLLTMACGVAVGRILAGSSANRGLVALAIVVGLWLITGMLAFRVTRRFLQMVRAARAIGDGALATRVDANATNGELEVLGLAINDMAARLQRQLADQKQLLAAVSHELRTPLGHLRVLIDSARDGGADDVMCSELEREVLQLDSLVGRLLSSSRLEFSQLNLHDVNVGEVVREAASQAGLSGEIVDAADDTSAPVDATLLRSAIANLLDNARLHGGGAVAIRVDVVPGADEQSEELRVEVDDAGPGVALDRQGVVFEPFVPSAAGGLGLGMALVARIAAAHGGHAWLGDRPGGGARAGFSVRRDAA